MEVEESRFDRSERFFGVEGQQRIAATRLVVVGCGGLGSIFAQQAVYLGFRSFGLVDRDLVTGSSMNRLVGAVPSDVGVTLKVDVARRTVMAVDPGAVVDAVPEWLTAPESKELIGTADVVVGCLDDDLARLELLALTTTSGVPYLDLGTEITEDGGAYGGRVIFGLPGVRCVHCLGELDEEELALGHLSPEQRRARDESYGISKSELGGKSPAVVSLNGVIASLGLTELMAFLTGLRQPAITLTYRGERGIVRRRMDEPTLRCPYCRRD